MSRAAGDAAANVAFVAIFLAPCMVLGTLGASYASAHGHAFAALAFVAFVLSLAIPAAGILGDAFRNAREAIACRIAWRDALGFAGVGAFWALFFYVLAVCAGIL